MVEGQGDATTRKIWAIADTHLSSSVDKPMDIFGPAWEMHDVKIAEAWRERVAEEDYVLIPGDISWGMSLDEARADLALLNDLPGEKILGKGNHDYWWPSAKKLRDFCEAEGFERLHFLYNNAYRIDVDPSRTVIVVGTRAWLVPSDWESEQDEKIYQRELGRFDLSIKASLPLAEAAKAEGREVTRLAMLHYPPRLSHPAQDTPFHEVLQEEEIQLCIYGHIHGSLGRRRQVNGRVGSVEYKNVAADGLHFIPELLIVGNLS